MAREIFLTEGYGAASMSAIAAAVGGSKGTLYTYFKSKSELFGEVVRNTSEDPDWDSDFGPAAGAETTPDLAQVLTRIGERVLGMICRPHTVALYRVVIGEAGRFPELGEAFYTAGPKARVEALTALIARAMQAGQLRADDPERAAHHFVSLCKSRVHQNLLWSVGPPPAPQDVQAEVASAVRVFLDGYRA